jgi:hypothetical protein
MFKINLKKIVICLLLAQTIIISFSNAAFAEPIPVDPNELLFNGASKATPKTGEMMLTVSGSFNSDSYQNVSKLPNVTLEQAVGNAIKTVLKVTMYLTIIAIVVAALYYIISQGKEEDLTKARNIILYLVIGMAIISAAYAITFGLAKFDFFQKDATTQTPPKTNAK